MVFNKESDFENALIKKLSSDCGWSPVILKNKTEKELIENWANIIFNNNRTIDRLGDYPLTDSEMSQIIEQINALKTPLKLNTFINGKTISIKRDNPEDTEHFGKEVSLEIYDRLKIAGGNSCYQIVEQPKFPTSHPLASDRRGDLMLLINGMPFIHIELKRSGVPVSQACEQIVKYSKEGIFSQGLFSLVQVFVAMNPDETVYFANPGTDGKFRKEFYFHWADVANTPINDWVRIADSLLSIPMAHELIGFYTVADNTDGVLKVMRSYQYFASKQIVAKVAQAQWDAPDCRGGYIYHTTGSGKTLTSFKAAQIIAECGYADKIVFLMDRIELGTQSFLAFLNFAGDIISVQSTEDTRELIDKLKSDNRNNRLIVTSHQKMCRIKDEIKTREKEIEKINKKHLVFIVDEAHRDVFGDMFAAIKETFPKAVRFGFTGTPIMDENAKNNNANADVFGAELHRYSIADGIRDKNVLGFHAVPVLVYPEKEIRKNVALDQCKAKTEQAALNDKNKSKIFYKFYRDMPMAGDKDENGEYHSGVEDYLPKTQYANEDYYNAVVKDIKDNWLVLSASSKFHALFATSSIPEACGYYEIIKKEFPELKIAAVFDPSVDNNGNGTFKEESLIEMLEDYNSLYDKHFDIPGYAKYKKDVTARLAHKEPYVGIENDKNKQIDLVIVVDQLLTGFDSKWINTLYMDKLQENENIIQSFSRTNRLFNNLEKPFGTIRYYRKPFTMKKNIEKAIKLYSGDKPFGIFVQKLAVNLNGMNQTFDEINSLFKNSGIDDFSVLPEEIIAKKKFSELFKCFSEYLSAAKIQDFKWSQNKYECKSDDKNETIVIHLDETTYMTLLQRYKELAGSFDPSDIEDVPYDIDPNISELDTELIDSQYMDLHFQKYYKFVHNGADQETLNAVLAELHRSFAMLSQEEQKFANIFLTDVQNGQALITEGRTFRDYITEYQTKCVNDRISKFARAFDLDEELLRSLVVNDKSDFSTLNSYGQFDRLMETLNKKKAKAYLEEKDGTQLPMRKVSTKMDSLVKEFIIQGGFDL